MTAVPGPDASATDGRRVPLNAVPEARTVTLTGDDQDLRESATAAIAELLADPPLVLLTSSCSSALDASAALVHLEPGDEVVVSAFTFPTSASPFVARGATVRFADVDPVTANVTPETLRSVLTDRTRAVVVTHYAGVAVDLAPFAEAFARDGIEVVEDAAHGLFASAAGIPLGRTGRFGCLSFHRTKNVSAIEGGALVVNRPEDVDVALVAVDKGTNRVRFEQGQVPAYEWKGVGSSWRMAEGSVRYLAAELEQRAAIQRRRHEVWDRYLAELAPWADASGVPLPVVPEGATGPAHLFHLVLPSLEDRDGLVAHAAQQGVQLARHYRPLPQSEFGTARRAGADPCPVAGQLGDRLVRIPLHHQLRDDDVDRVVAAVTSFSLRR